MPVLGVIPARLGSSRLPRKPLLSLAGEPLVVRVARRVADAQVCDALVVATDATEVAAVVERAGFRAVLTSEGAQSGTERVAEVAAKQPFSEFDIILNVQGDEPLVAHDALRGALDCVRRGNPIGTAAAPLDSRLAQDPNRVKVVVSLSGRAVYFSRAPIPYDRDGTGRVTYHQHVGVYAYTRGALAQWVRLPSVPEERWERLEQLRPLLHGLLIGVALGEEPAAPGVDTAEDLRLVEAAFATHAREVSP